MKVMTWQVLTQGDKVGVVASGCKSPPQIVSYK